jgi:hypothetical protein
MGEAMTKVGDRVRLVRCTDQYTRLEPGAEGTVSFIDDMGTVHVNWDSGARLGLIRREGDAWELISESEMERSSP